MGAYLNPGREAFEAAINSEIYVDKTKLIRFLNTVVKTEQKYVSVSRPRRFGKSMAVSMICAYYDREANSRILFEDKKLADSQQEGIEKNELEWDKYLGCFDVIRLVMTRFFKKKKSVSESLEELQKLVIRDYKAKYPEVSLFDETNLVQTLEDVYSATKRHVVIVIDEWDAVFRMKAQLPEKARGLSITTGIGDSSRMELEYSKVLSTYGLLCDRLANLSFVST